MKHWETVLGEMEVFKEHKDTAALVKLYSHVAHFLELEFFYVFHKEVNNLFDTKHGIVNVNQTPWEIFENVGYNQCFHGKLMTKVGNAEGKKYVCISFTFGLM